MLEEVAQDSPARSESLLTEAESALRKSWNETTQSYPEDAYVPQLVAAQAMATPDAVALAANGHGITYRDLDSQANRLAHHLLSLGAAPQTLVVLCLERSVALVVAALGVLKSGAAYVPLDPTWPPERLLFILNDCQATIVVTQQGMSRRLPAGPWQVVDLDLDGEQIASLPPSPPKVDTTAEDLAYVIYTSGSTGLPKGVQISHGSLLNLVFWHQRTFAVSTADRATLLASPGFDASVWELWPYVTAGVSVCLPEEALRGDARGLRDWLIAQKITITFVPTPMAELMMALTWPTDVSLRVLLTGAEILHRRPSPSLPFVLVNNYGPTECTVVATSGIISPNQAAEDRPSIGRPIANTKIYILDENLREVPIGVIGELHIGGKGLARGYLNQPALTAGKFIPSPFSSAPGDLLYKTGDLARYLSDGQIAFMGRTDDQIKIRGYRIDPSEIVTALDRHPAVSASHVIAREDGLAEKQLVAYIVPVPGSRPAYGELRDFLRSHLPEYMIPAVFVSLDSLPLTSNGKVDRHALPIPNESNILHSELGAPARTLVEKRVAAIVATLLGLRQVGANDNFFLLGGHSLLGTQVIARVRDSFDVDLSLRTLFEAPTVAQLSAEIERLLMVKLGAMSEEEAQRKLGALAS